SNAANDNSNNAGLGIVGVNGNVTVSNLVVNGTSGVKTHGINIFESNNVTLSNVTSQNNSKSGITINGSTVTVNNVTTKNNAWGGINADQAADAPDPTVLTVLGASSHTETTGPEIWVDNKAKAVSVIDSGNQYNAADYAHDGVTGARYSLKISKVGNEAELRAALGNTLIDTIVLNNDISLAAELDINRKVTIDGATHKITASFNGASVIQIGANDVTLKNLVEDGGGISANNRGINVYKVTGVTLDGVTASNNKKNGVVVNGSTVIAHSITTINNGYGGIDIDLGSGVTTPAALTITGVSSHTETAPAITIDDITKAVSFTDSNSQYTATDAGNKRTYTLITQGSISTVTPTFPVTNSTEPINVTVASTVTNPKIDVSLLLTAGTATLPQISVISEDVNVNVTAGTTVTSTGLTTWNGVINAPTVTTSYTLTPEVGTTANAVLALEVGAGDIPLVFSNAVKLTFPGQAGNLIGWSQGGTFHAITDTCDSATAPTLTAGADCRINVGADLVVWTKHFTTFVTYTQTAVASTGGVSGGGGSAVATTVTPTAPVGQVLGAQSFNFTLSLSNGSKGDEVKQLQTRLNADGATLTVDGKFGSKTKAALVKWQKAHKLSADGKVGAKTRAALNVQ
ncbi:MAG: Ig domain protein group 2 domain protein, partial [Candidatus Nomurabacteria bacterium]|nr:Ig domain protein group 2 domain protein [Candidatus Nomurabacteria bacterium]